MDISDDDNERPNLKGDRLNFFLLICLYCLQASVFGLPHAISLVLQKRNISYQDQAEFSIVGYSFGFKILWAPIIDSVYWRKLGRRKSWLVPSQLLIGTLLLLISFNVDSWLGSEDGTRKPNVRLLTVIFFTCGFLASTQDIAVDAWSLTLFQKKNIGYAAVCQSIGSVLGHFLTFVGFILLDSKDFCNHFRSVPQDHGFVTFANFIFFFSMMFLLITTIILVFKTEKRIDDDEHKAKIGETYALLWKILHIRPVQIIVLFMLTCWISFGPVRNVGSLKVLDAGVPRDAFALMTVPSLPFQLMLPCLLGRYLVGPRPLRLFPIVYVLRLINSVAYAFLIFSMSSYPKGKNNVLQSWYYWALVTTYNFDNLTGFVMITAVSAFFSRISDPRFGGVYMTLLACVTNIAFMWTSTSCLWLVDRITLKSCSFDNVQGKQVCDTIFDGFYTEVIVCTLVGLLWLVWGVKRIYKLEKLSSSAFVVQQELTVVDDPALNAMTG